MAVASLKGAIMGSQMRALLRSNGQYIVNTNASDKQVSCVLLRNEKMEGSTVLVTGRTH